jgi:hypothetical protein
MTRFKTKASPSAVSLSGIQRSGAWSSVQRLGNLGDMVGLLVNGCRAVCHPCRRDPMTRVKPAGRADDRVDGTLPAPVARPVTPAIEARPPSV